MTGGGSLGPNITGSMTAGIGSWSEADFTTALRTGTAKSGKKFCALMVAYSASALSDVEVKNLYAYLKSVPNDMVNTGSQCP
jgi:hypothetical protein